VYDAADGYVLMYGGTNNTPYPSDASWTYLNGAWAVTGLYTSPPTLSEGGMAYDSADGYVVLFGVNGNDGVMETWTFLAGTWTNLTGGVGSAPGGRVLFVMVDDTYDGYVLLFGGTNLSTDNGMTDTWSFSAGTWTKLNPTLHPTVRTDESGAYDPTTGTVVVFGGLAANGSAPIGTGVWQY
jgi:hypothetical protein